VSIQVKPDRVLTAFQVIGSVSQDWLVVSAIVQAGAAVVIGAFTYALWRATDRLAEATKKYADLTEQMARLQSVSLAREGQATAPSLIAAGGSRNVGDDAAVSEIRVENIGGSSAYDVEIDTSWGTTKIQGPVREGIRAQGPVAEGGVGSEPRQGPDHPAVPVQGLTGRLVDTESGRGPGSRRGLTGSSRSNAARRPEGCEADG